MISARSKILLQYPFYGYLIMHLKLGVTDCGTACTDMKHLLFDPDFAGRLSEEEMIFVMLHEVLHCALSHCTRGKDYIPDIFNAATDIVVNSNILSSMGIPEYWVDGYPVMHKTPDGQEGHLFSAEEVYGMLLRLPPRMAGIGGSGEDGIPQEDPSDTGDSMASLDHGGIDSHDIWDEIEEDDAISDSWKKVSLDAAKKILV